MISFTTLKTEETCMSCDKRPGLLAVIGFGGMRRATIELCAECVVDLQFGMTDVGQALLRAGCKQEPKRKR